MTVAAHKETLEFQAEAQQLLHLVIHSLYSDKEIFLRELISNASDACDKLRFEALGDDALYEDDAELKVQIDFDKDKRTLTITDNGIGMNRAEVMENIGTIASSGTRRFIESLTGDQSKDSHLIGQFGVGFYSAFIVADKVTVVTRRAGLGAEHGVSWESEGKGAYTLETVEKAARGTEITLHIKEDEQDFLDGWRLRHIVKKYSDHINLPILMKSEDKEKQDEYEPINQASALWARPKKEISEEEYNEFYKHIAHDFEDPMLHTHNQVEGTQTYTSLFFIPKRPPFDLWDKDKRQGIKLYVKRVFIMDEAEHLMPNYLRFVRGVVDSDDLPLNVSREILQHNRVIDKIRGASVKKVLGLLEGLARDDKERYAEFWKGFGAVLKEGPAEDAGNRERIARLLRFASTNSDGSTQDVALEDYISRMKEGQDKIYYITADSYAAAKNSPHLEIFTNKGIEVLLLHERVDEWLMSHLNEFDGKRLQSVAKGELDLGELQDESEKDEIEKSAKEHEGLLEKMKATLGDKVKEVRVTHRLTSSPSCLVVEDGDMAMGLQNILKQYGHDVPGIQPILEINPGHPLVQRIRDETDDARFGDWASLLFDQAMLSEGGQLEDPASFVRKINEMLLHLSQ